MVQPLKILDIDFASLQFFEKYVISIVQEDAMVDYDSVKKLQSTMESFYGDDFYGYISYRNNHYSINPLIHLNCGKMLTLVGMAVVCNDHLREITAAFEEKFFSKPFSIFNDLDLAINWMDDLVDKRTSPDNYPPKKDQ